MRSVFSNFGPVFGTLILASSPFTFSCSPSPCRLWSEAHNETQRFFNGSVAEARDTVPLHPIPKKQTMAAVYTEESTHPPLHERELLRRLLVVLYRLEPVVTKY